MLPAEHRSPRRTAHRESGLCPGRDGERETTGSLEGARRGRGQFVASLDVLVKQVPIEHQLLAENLVGGVDKAAVTLGIGQRRGEGIEVEAHGAAGRENVIRGGRGAVGKKRGVPEKSVALWKVRR